MRRRHSAVILAALAALMDFSNALAAAQKIHVQTDISAATIVETEAGYSVSVNVLATDLEEMFRKSLAEIRGVDLSGPGVLELEIGRFVARRVAIREHDGHPCQARVERAGEDPSNDETVLVAMTFECATRDVVYDASKLLATHGPRAWQVVSIGGRQHLINAESPPTPIGASS